MFAMRPGPLLRCALLVLCCAAAPAIATTGPTAPQVAEPAGAGDIRPGPRQLDEVVVSGDMPGPGLWRVSHGDNELWVLGSLGPLPRRMRWKSEEVDARIAESAVVVMPPGVNATTDIGRFRAMFLLPSLLRARNNPDDKRLPDVLPAELYQRWEPLRQRYFGRGRGIEKRRPIIAGGELYERAIKRAGLDRGAPVREAVEKRAKRAKVPVERPVVKVTIENPKALIREFTETALDDTECFGRILDRLEVEVATMQARANAWAVGDLEALRELPQVDSGQACIDAVLGAEAFQRRGFDDLPERLRQAWLDAAETALKTHRSSFALLPIGDLLADDGYLAALAARGYAVEAPE
jgi:hypothetical protein